MSSCLIQAFAIIESQRLYRSHSPACKTVRTMFPDISGKDDARVDEA